MIARVLSAAGIIGVAGGYFAFRWYMTTLPDIAYETMATRLPESFGMMMAASIGVSVLYFVLTAWKPQVLRPWLAGVMTVAILVLGLAPEETAREIVRKPWVAGQYVYGNQILGATCPRSASSRSSRSWPKRASLRRIPSCPSTCGA